MNKLGHLKVHLPPESGPGWTGGAGCASLPTARASDLFIVLLITLGSSSSVVASAGGGLALLEASPLPSVVGGGIFDRKPFPSVELSQVVGDGDPSRGSPASRPEAVGRGSSCPPGPRKGTVFGGWVNGWVGDGVPSGSTFAKVSFMVELEPGSAVAFVKCEQMAINVHIRKHPRNLISLFMMTLSIRIQSAR